MVQTEHVTDLVLDVTEIAGLLTAKTHETLVPRGRSIVLRHTDAGEVIDSLSLDDRRLVVHNGNKFLATVVLTQFTMRFLFFNWRGH